MQIFLTLFALFIDLALIFAYFCNVLLILGCPFSAQLHAVKIHKKLCHKKRPFFMKYISLQNVQNDATACPIIYI